MVEYIQKASVHFFGSTIIEFKISTIIAILGKYVPYSRLYYHSLDKDLTKITTIIISIIFLQHSLLMTCNAADKIQLIYSSANWIPFSYADEAGTPQGLYVDLIDEIFVKQLGIEIEHQQLPWKRAQRNVELGKADFTITVKSGQRLQYATPSELPLLQLYLHIFTYKNHKQIAEIENITSGADIKALNLIPVTNIGNSWHKKNIDDFGIPTHYVKDEDSAFKVVAGKRADITIEPIHAGSYLIKKLGLQDKIQVTEAKFGPLDFFLLFSKKSPHHSLMPQINAAIQKLTTDGTLEKISQKYKDLK